MNDVCNIETQDNKASHQPKRNELVVTKTGVFDSNTCFSLVLVAAAAALRAQRSSWAAIDATYRLSLLGKRNEWFWLHIERGGACEAK